MNQNELALLADIARLSAKITAYEDVLDEIAASTTDERARVLAWGVLGDQEDAA